MLCVFADELACSDCALAQEGCEVRMLNLAQASDCPDGRAQVRFLNGQNRLVRLAPPRHRSMVCTSPAIRVRDLLVPVPASRPAQTRSWAGNAQPSRRELPANEQTKYVMHWARAFCSCTSPGKVRTRAPALPTGTGKCLCLNHPAQLRKRRSVPLANPHRRSL